MIGVRRSFDGCKRNRQSGPLVELKFFGKNQKVGSWTEQLGKWTKEEKTRSEPLNLICISILFSFSFSKFL
jgi:hypothetical protein